MTFGLTSVPVTTVDVLDDLTFMVGAGLKTLQAADNPATTAKIFTNVGFDLLAIKPAVGGNASFELFDSADSLKYAALYEESNDKVIVSSEVEFDIISNASLALFAQTTLDFETATGDITFSPSLKAALVVSGPSDASAFLTITSVDNVGINEDNPVIITVEGSEADIALDILAKGSQRLNLGVGTTGTVAIGPNEIIKANSSGVVTIGSATTATEIADGRILAIESKSAQSKTRVSLIAPTSANEFSIGVGDNSEDSGAAFFDYIDGTEFRIKTSAGTAISVSSLDVTIAGDLNSANILPATDATFALGSEALRYTGLFVDDKINFPSSLDFESDDGTFLNYTTTSLNASLSLTSPSANGIATFRIFDSQFGFIKLEALYDEANDIARIDADSSFEISADDTLDLIAETTLTLAANVADIVFETNSIERMRIANDGVVTFTDAVIMTSTTGGFQFPPHTTTQRNAIASPVAGEVLWNSTTDALNVRNGSAAWRGILTSPANSIDEGGITFGSGSSPHSLEDDPDNLFYDIILKRLGVGTNTPSAQIDVVDLSGNAEICITGAGAEVRHNVNEEYDINYKRTAGGAIMDIRALPLDGTSGASYRFGLASGSTGNNTIFLFEPNGSVVQTRLSSSGQNSFINAQGARLAIGKSSALVHLDVQAAIDDTVPIFALETTGTNGALVETNVGIQDPEVGSVPGVDGQEYKRADGNTSGSYEFMNSAWLKRSRNPSSIKEILNGAELSELETSGTVESSAPLVVRFKTPLTKSTNFEGIGTTADLKLTDDGENNSYVYINTSTFLTALTGGDIGIDNMNLVAGIPGTQLLDYTGGIEGIFFDQLEFLGTSVVINWDLGTASRISSKQKGPIVSLQNLSIINWTSGLVVDSAEVFAAGGCFATQTDDVGNSTPLFEIKNSSNQQGRATITDFFGNMFGSESTVRVDAGLPDDYRVLVKDGQAIYKDTSTLFDTSGSTGAFTVVANNSIAATAITGVTDSSGVASFTHAGTSPPLGSIVVISGFTTNTDYNKTGKVTARTATTFEVDFIDFGTDESGSFLVTGVTVTATAHGLTQGTGVTLDTTESVQYDGGFLIYNIQTNSFDVPAVFDATEAGTWSTEGLDGTDPRVMSLNNAGFKSSKVIAFGAGNDNESATSITLNTYVPLNLGTSFTSDPDVTERFKLTNLGNGVFKLTALEDFTGFLTGVGSMFKSGSSEFYRFAISIDGAIPVFVSASFIRREIKSTLVPISLFFPISVTKGQTVQVMEAGDGTADNSTMFDFTFGVK